MNPPTQQSHPGYFAMKALLQKHKNSHKKEIQVLPESIDDDIAFILNGGSFIPLTGNLDPFFMEPFYLHQLPEGQLT